MKKNGLLPVLLSSLFLHATTAAWGQNYVDLDVSVVDLNGAIRLTYDCNFDTYNYQGIPLDVYLLAIHNPVISDGPASITDAFSGGVVRLFRPGMQSSFTPGSGPIAPTFSNVIFPPAPIAGSLIIDTVSTNTYEGNYAIAAVFTRHGSADFIRSDGLPVEISNTFSPFQYHAIVLGDTIHVGDGYDPYMATWEVPYPEGIAVDRYFTLNPAPKSGVVLRGAYWGTYYANNPVYINKLLAGYIPGQFNGDHWNRSYSRVPYSFFREGINLITFKCSPYKTTGHWDNYMAKGWELFYN
jgi:hypothetical protein